MHLGNGAITPECAAITLTAAAAGLGAAAFALRRQPISHDKLMLAAGLGAIVFASQAINVPVLPGISGHLVGGVLLAWVLGPGLGALSMAIILALQALVLGDGGLAALGANVLNMSLLPAACVAVCRRLAATQSRGSHAASAIAGTVSVTLAALLIVIETALFRSGVELAGWQTFAAQLIATHLWLGLLEGGLTMAIVASLAWMSQPTGRRSWRIVLVSAVAAIALAIAIPWSSVLPDGYEAAAQSWSAIAQSP